jgi:tRNA-dihydrouridine synthase
MQDAENPLMRDLTFTEAERPVVAQFFSSKPEMMEYASALAVELGFDGVDINMGCPDKSIEKQGAGAAHIKNPVRAKEVIRGALKGTKGKIPVSVKTRMGYNTEILDEWVPALLEEDISALTMHLRTRKEMSKVDAHWELLPKVVSLRDSAGVSTLILGNGDVKDIEDAKKKAEASGADGIMLGRAIFGNPWVFSGKKPEDLTREERLSSLQELAEAFSKLTPHKHYSLLKKHFKAFISGWEGAAELRGVLMETNDIEGFRRVVNDKISGWGIIA